MFGFGDIPILVDMHDWFTLEAHGIIGVTHREIRDKFPNRHGAIIAHYFGVGGCVVVEIPRFGCIAAL